VLKQQMQEFFDGYAKASLSGDARAVSRAYFPIYIEAAPSGVGAFSVDDDYLKGLKVKSETMHTMGLTQSDVTVVAADTIAAGCVLVDAKWHLRFAPPDAKAREATFHISYVVRISEKAPQILLAVSHDDEQQLLADIGLADGA